MPQTRTAEGAQSTLTTMVNELDADNQIRIINSRIEKVKAALTGFIDKAGKQAILANSNPGKAAVCQSLDELMPSFSELKASLHGARFIKLITSGGLTSLPQITDFLNKKQSDLANDEKTINDRKAYFKCGQ